MAKKKNHFSLLGPPKKLPKRLQRILEETRRFEKQLDSFPKITQNTLLKEITL